MEMVPFYTKFPKIAKEETRCIIIPKDGKLPAGKYPLMESYCNDHKCDCRRVFINVLHDNKIKILATIGYGLDSLQFHKEWIGDERFAQDVKGPILELGGIQTEYAKRLLELFKIVLKDEAYIERLMRHYRMWKNKK